MSIFGISASGGVQGGWQTGDSASALASQAMAGAVSSVVSTIALPAKERDALAQALGGQASAGAADATAAALFPQASAMAQSEFDHASRALERNLRLYIYGNPQMSTTGLASGINNAINTGLQAGDSATGTTIDQATAAMAEAASALGIEDVSE